MLELKGNVWNNVGFRGARFTCGINEFATVGEIRLLNETCAQLLQTSVSRIILQFTIEPEKSLNPSAAPTQPEKFALNIINFTYVLSSNILSYFCQLLSAHVVKRLIVTIYHYHYKKIIM